MLLGLLSTYKEGRTAQHALRSLLTACDHVLVVEGPAGVPLPDDVPPSDFGGLLDDERVTYSEGQWRSDARKRTGMLELAHQHEAPTWGVWLDGDEVLVNPEYLRDWTDYFTWQDALTPDEPPTMRIPLRLVELDGSISMSYVKLIRVDLVRSYSLSIANLTNSAGMEERAGNVHEHYSGWIAKHEKAREGYLYWPPGPAPLDPFIVHRSLLRHPLRAGLRLHDQEREEISRLIGTPPTST